MRPLQTLSSLLAPRRCAWDRRRLAGMAGTEAGPTRLLLALMLVLGGLGACRPPAGLPRLAVTAPAAERVAPASVLAAAQGVVNLVVHWPERDVRDFRAQLIPTSTDRIDFEAKTLAGAVAATASVARTDSSTTEATTSMTLDAATYDFGAKAYRGTTEIAKAGPARVQVVAGAQVDASLTLGPLFAPTITSFEPTSGPAGATVIITGTNLKPAGVATPVVKFNGIAAAVTAGTATTLTVTVPAGSTLGKIDVVSDGISVTSTDTFWVGSGLTLSAGKASWDTTGSNSRLVLAQDSLTFSASPSWVVKAGETLAQYGVPPKPGFTSSNGSAGTIDAGSGSFTAADAAATTTVKARLGALESAGITVTTVKVTGVALDKTALTLYRKPAPDGIAPPSFAATSSIIVAAASFSSPVTISGTTWSSSDATKATVSASGLVTALGVGSVEIAAKSIDDPRVLATASVVVRSQAVWDLAKEFSPTNNPSGAWRYGWKATFSAAFNLFDLEYLDSNMGWERWYTDKVASDDRTPTVQKNVSASTNYGVAPGQVSLHPGPGWEPAAVRWTAPHSARMAVDVTFGAGDSGTMEYVVQENGTTQVDVTSAGDRTYQFTRDPMASGKVFEFAVGGGYGFGTTPVSVRISEF